MQHVRAMRIKRLSIVIAIGGCAMIVAGILGPAPWLARQSIFEFTAREPKNRNPAEPGEPPEWGSATLVDDLEVPEGAPSVS